MNTSIRNILVPVNFSDTSLNALHTAMQMCKRHQAKLHLLYVLDYIDYFPVAGRASSLDVYTDKIFLRNKYVLEKIAQSVYNDFKIVCNTYIEKGLKVLTISNTAKLLNCDLIIMGTHSGVNKETYLHDTTAFKVLQTSPCSVLTVPAKKEISYFKNIVFPVRPDFNTLNTCDSVKSLITQNGSSVHIVGLLEKSDGNVFSSLRKVVNKVRIRLNRENIPLSTETYLTQNATRKIINAGKNNAADLIVIKASTQRNFWQYFFGNHTQKIIRNPYSAVLCVK